MKTHEQKYKSPTVVAIKIFEVHKTFQFNIFFAIIVDVLNFMNKKMKESSKLRH